MVRKEEEEEWNWGGLYIFDGIPHVVGTWKYYQQRCVHVSLVYYVYFTDICTYQIQANLDFKGNVALGGELCDSEEVDLKNTRPAFFAKKSREIEKLWASAESRYQCTRIQCHIYKWNHIKIAGSKIITD